MEQNLTLHALASRIGYSTTHVSEVERGRTSISEALVTAVDRALDARGQLVALYPAVRLERLVERGDRETSRRGALRSVQEVDDVRRRAFIALGLSVVLLGPEAAARASRDDWDRIAHAWSYEIATAPDARALLPGLAADLKRLHASGGPQHVIAQLASYVASIAVTSGEVATARRWWRRARSATVVSGDSHLLSFVAGRQAVQGLLGVYSPAQALLLADDALRITNAPCVGRMHALSAKAQAHALLGRQRQTRAAMHDLEHAFERLPRDVTRETISALGWSEHDLRFAGSFVGAFGNGGHPAGEAVKLHPPARWRGHAQVRLHQAAAETDPSDAVAALNDLTEVQRSDRFVRQTALRVLAACDARGAKVTELREALA